MEDKLAAIFSGGGMKCAFGAGFMYGLVKKYSEIVFDTIIGASGSVPTAIFATSNQSRLPCISWKKDLSTKLMINKLSVHIDYLVDEILKNSKFDFDAFYSSKTECLIPAINTKTGEVKYFSNRDEFFLKNPEQIYEAVRASASIPIFTGLHPAVEINGETYCDCINTSSYRMNVETAVEKGANKILIIDHDPQINRFIDREQLFFDSWLGWQNDIFKINYNKLEEKINSYVPPKDVRILKIDLPSWSSASTLDNDKKILRETVNDGFRMATFNRKLFHFFYGNYTGYELSYQ